MNDNTSSQDKPVKATIMITIYEDTSIDVRHASGQQLNSIEWLGVLAAAFLGTTSFNRDGAPVILPAEEKTND